jgi:hypothetical protein
VFIIIIGYLFLLRAAVPVLGPVVVKSIVFFIRACATLVVVFLIYAFWDVFLTFRRLGEGSKRARSNRRVNYPGS